MYGDRHFVNLCSRDFQEKDTSICLCGRHFLSQLPRGVIDKLIFCNMAITVWFGVGCCRVYCVGFGNVMQGDICATWQELRKQLA